MRYILLISGILSVGFSALASLLPIGLYNQAVVSGMFPTLITPASYTFSIWSIIYLSWIILGSLVAVGKVQVSRRNTYLLAGAQILSSLWLIPSQYLYISLSLVVMIGVFILLILAFKNINTESKYYRGTLGLFLGWILVAFIANLHLTLVSQDVYVYPEILTYSSIIVGLAVNLYFIYKYNIFMPAFVFIWAAIGIINGQENTITQVLSILSVVTLGSIALESYISRKK